MHAGATPPPVLVIMGVSGSGKSTVGELLAERLGWDFQEGDDLHAAANVAKMAASRPLDDEDREPWLARVAGWINEHAAAGRPGVITCSALKRRYRDQLRDDAVIFVCLMLHVDQLARRLRQRTGHFLPETLLQSQIEIFEPPGPDERAITLDASASPVQLVDEIVARLNLA